MEQSQLKDFGMDDVVSEGAAMIFKDDDVFFNPAQKFNRDISVEVIRDHVSGNKDARILDATSATGIRGIRYLKEINGSIVYLNDVSKKAFQMIKRNVALNGFGEDGVVEYVNLCLRNISADKDKKTRVNLVMSECNALMASLPCFFDVVDVDPYGSCSEYINNAVWSVKHGGLLCFSATDKAVLCSNQKKCLKKYSTRIMKSVGMNELPLRTILSLISRQAGGLGARIEPVMSLSVDFYVRLFVRVFKRGKWPNVDENSHVFLCECHNILDIQQKQKNINGTCTNCGRDMKLCGPFWNGQLHDTVVVKRILDRLQDTAENKRLLGILRILRQESPSLFYYEIPRLCFSLKIDSIKQMALMNALSNMGYTTSYTHAELNAIKTNAPIWVINKVLVLYHCGDKKKIEEAGISFEESDTVKELKSTEFFRGTVRSGMGPLSVSKVKKP